MNDDTLPPALGELFTGGAGDRTLPVPLPPGRIVRTEEDDPALWMTEGPAPYGLWARAHAEHPRSGLWPLLLGALDGSEDDDFRPWGSDELSRERITSPDHHDAAGLLAGWWSENADDEVTAPYGRRWPGTAPATEPQADPDELAREYADDLAAVNPSMRLGLVPAEHGADTLAACGWTGPLNFTNDTGEIAAVVRDWEQRFGVRVVGVGFAELYLSVAAPPVTPEAALRVAAEHFAVCPDNIWQGAKTLEAYAGNLAGTHAWQFWWD